MAAYGALVSLIYIIDQLHHHPSPPIALDKLQVQLLTQNITFLQEFLEAYNFHGDSEEIDHLASCITKAAYGAEDVIESYIVENIRLPAPKSCDDVQIRSNIFYDDLQRVIEEMDLIKKVAMAMATEKAAVKDLRQQRRPNVSESVAFPGSASTGLKNDAVVGLDELLREIMDKLKADGGNRFIPIVGMGGIGKTTLAKHLYSHPDVKKHFDICVWVTISQHFNTKDILCEVLSQANKASKEQFMKMSEGEVQLKVHQYLSGRRYLVVMDDMWSLDSWNEINHSFPDKKGSRVLMTTRLSAIASQLANNNGIEMKFLDEVSSWTLFSKTVFGEKTFPHELEEIGKKIVGSCRGLPLSIVVIGGLLRKLEHTPECWESIRKRINSVVNLENDEHCLKILKMSYNHLPVHLKPCFLYMGMFEEDSEINVATLCRLWISEGFLKPLRGKSLETTAKEYLKDLVGRNLLLAHKLKRDGKIKYCKIHDLLRDLCLREAQKEKFYNVVEPDIHHERRIVIPESTSEENVLDVLQSMSCARSLIYDRKDVPLKPNCGLLRSLHTIGINTYKYREIDKNVLDDVFELVNLRHLAVGVKGDTKLTSSINFLWNLHSIIVHTDLVVNAPAEIWKMSQLRHVHFPGGVHLPYPPSGNDDTVIMENLHTIRLVRGIKCFKEVKRIPNIMKLRIEHYDDADPYHCLNNLEFLYKLESFFLRTCTQIDCITFPKSLQKLNLYSRGCYFDCEKVLEKTGSLPRLRRMVLNGGLFKTSNWKTVEGKFPSLQDLVLIECKNLKEWEMADWSHFPRLQHLHLSAFEELEVIPSEIGEIPTLKSIMLRRCSTSAVESLKRIVEEQEYYQGEDQLPFRARVWLTEEQKKQEALRSYDGPNFKVN